MRLEKVGRSDKRRWWGKDYNYVVDFSITSSRGDTCNTLENEIFLCVFAQALVFFFFFFFNPRVFVSVGKIKTVTDDLVAATGIDKFSVSYPCDFS